MVLRIAAKDKLNTYIPVLWLNHVAVGLEIDQARSSPPLSFSLLTACTYNLIELLGGSTVEADAKFEKGLPGRIGTIPHGTSRRNLDSIASCGKSLWKVLQYYIECKMVVPTECNELLSVLWTWLYERDPLGHTRTPLREGLCIEVGRTHPTFSSSWPILSTFGVVEETRGPGFVRGASMGEVFGT